jgi:hypothetical protein
MKSWNFVETAMEKIPNAGFTKSSVYYFYKRCESFPDIDAHFQSFLDADLIGDSASFGSSVYGLDDSNFAGALSDKNLDTKKIEGVLSDMRDQASSIIGHLVSVGEEQKEMIELSRGK